MSGLGHVSQTLRTHLREKLLSQNLLFREVVCYFASSFLPLSVVIACLVYIDFPILADTCRDLMDLEDQV